MTLDRQQLHDGIVAAMARQLPPEESLTQEARTFASDLAGAIHDYVSAGEVRDVKVSDGTRQLTQTGSAKVR